MDDGEFWADKLMDLANLELIILVFSQLTTPKVYLNGIFLGIIIYGALTVVSVKFRRKKYDYK